MANLYNITQEHLDIISMLRDSEGELTPEIEEKLNINSDEFEDKMDAYGRVIRNLQTDVEAIDAEIDRLTILKRSHDKTISRLKDFMLNALKVITTPDKKGVFHLSTTLFKFSTRRSTAVDIQPEFLPNDFLITRTITEPNKEAIRERLKLGVVITGVTIKENLNLQIK